MMKKLLAILLVILITIPAISQIKFGLKAGVSTTTVTMNDLVKVTSGSTTYTVDAISNAKYGFHGGAFLRLSLLGVYLQPELLFSTRTNEYVISDKSTPQSTASYVAKQNFNKLEIPVMVGLRLGPLRLNAGPAASLLINSPKALITDPNNDYKSLYSRMTIGYQAGISINLLKMLTFSLSYEGSLKKYQNQIENRTGTKFNLDDRPNAFLFSLGLMF